MVSSYSCLFLPGNSSMTVVVILSQQADSTFSVLSVASKLKLERTLQISFLLLLRPLNFFLERLPLP